LEKAFPIWDEAKKDESGFVRGRVIPISGRLIRNVMPEVLINSFLKPSLPADAELLALDDMILRMHPGVTGYGSDAFCLCVISKEFDPVPEGHSFPVVDILTMSNPLPDDPKEIAVFSIPTDRPTEIQINKNSLRMEIPKNRETKDSLTIVLRPIECPKKD
jgi:hypothetical protein